MSPQPINPPVPDIFGLPSAVTLEQLNMTPVALRFTEWVDSLFEPNGFSGVPDPQTDPMLCWNYLNNRRKVIQEAGNQKPLIRLADSNLNILTELTEELSCTLEELVADSGTAKIVIRYGHWLEDYMINGISIDQDLHLLIDPIPTQQDWRTRWGGKVKEISLHKLQDGTSTIEIMAISNREHMKHLLYGANPIFAPEIQIPKMWIIPGPLRSILFASGFINLARLFVPGLSGITNAFNPAAWINPLNPDALENFWPLSWPIQVAFVDPVVDKSMWSVLAATWTDWHSATSDLLSNAGCMCRAYTWLTTDADSPHTELSALIQGSATALTAVLNALGISGLDQLVDLGFADIDALVRPTRNCVVLSFEDHTGVSGPTGTVVDGLLDLIGVTLDDMITAVIFDQQSETFVNGEKIIDVNNYTQFFQTLLGIQTANPQVVWRDGEFTGLVDREVNMHKGSPLTIMTGGRSPTIVNDAQTFAIRYGLALLSSVIQLNIATGGCPDCTPVDFTQQVYFTPGLDNLYNGELDNCLLAWERYTDPIRALWNGDLSFQEYMERGSGSAYTVAGWVSLAEGHWKTRSFYGFIARYLNGKPWIYGVDFQLGDRVGFEQDGIIFVDNLAAVSYKYNRKQPIFLDISVGDDRDKHDPVARTLRTLTGIYSLVGAFLGEGTLFG